MNAVLRDKFRPLHRTFLVGGMLLALVIGLALPRSARADAIDVQLQKIGPDLVEHLREKGYRNVGVLKFRVEKGKKYASFNVGPLNSSMALRVETALLIYNPNDKLGIIHDANRIAAAKKLPTYMSPAGRQQLFQEKFPLAWGQSQVQADAFVTGLVRVPADMSRATVRLEIFDRSSNQLTTWREFDAKIDRNILAELGQTYLVRKRAVLDSQVVVREQDDASAKDDAAQRDNTNAPLPDVTDQYVQFEIRYDNAVQQVLADPRNPGEKQVVDPREGQEVQFVIRNISKERVGVVLKVNGQNTLYREEKVAEQCARWILDPGESHIVKGFYDTDNEGYQPFTILSPSESEAWPYSDYLGMIHLHVFVSGGDTKDTTGGEDNRPQISMSFESGKAYLDRRDPKRTQKDLRSYLNDKVLAKRGLIVEDKQAPKVGQKLQTVLFPNPTPVGVTVIRYYQPRKQ